MLGEWMVKLIDNPGTITKDLWIYRRMGGKRYILNHKGEQIEVKEGHATDYDNYFARFDDDEQIRAIAEAFSQYGVKTNNDHKNEGLLEATKYHLEDMRTLTLKGHK